MQRNVYQLQNGSLGCLFGPLLVFNARQLEYIALETVTLTSFLFAEDFNRFLIIMGFPAKLYAVIEGPNVVDSTPTGDSGIDRVSTGLSTSRTRLNEDI